MQATVDEQTLRAARQHAKTLDLLGVESMPRRAERATGSTELLSAASPPPAAAPGRDKRDALEALQHRYERESTVARSIKGWNKIVFGDGSADAALMFVGEAPGADEDVQGVPFVGRAGQKLNEMILAMGFEREHVYIANVLKVRPPNNRTPTPEESASDGAFLEEQIRIVGPRVIVTLGKPASNFLLRSTNSMGSMRGHWHDWEGIPLMPTYHPAYLLRSYTPENRRRVWSDLQQVVQRLRD